MLFRSVLPTSLNSAALVRLESGATIYQGSGTFANTFQLYGGTTGEAYGQIRADGSTFSGPLILMANATIGNPAESASDPTNRADDDLHQPHDATTAPTERTRILDEIPVRSRSTAAPPPRKINDAVSTTAKADTLLQSVDAAIAQVSTFRAKLGARQNQIETAINSVGVSIENLSASESRIRDADVAALSADMVSRNIMQQAGVSVLSQANSAPQSVLSLIRG